MQFVGRRGPIWRYKEPICAEKRADLDVQQAQPSAGSAKMRRLGGPGEAPLARHGTPSGLGHAPQRMVGLVGLGLAQRACLGH